MKTLGEGGREGGREPDGRRGDPTGNATPAHFRTSHRAAFRAFYQSRITNHGYQSSGLPIKQSQKTAQAFVPWSSCGKEQVLSSRSLQLESLQHAVQACTMRRSLHTACPAAANPSRTGPPVRRGSLASRARVARRRHWPASWAEIAAESLRPWKEREKEREQVSKRRSGSWWAREGVGASEQEKERERVS